MLKQLTFLFIATTALSAELPKGNLESTAFNPDPIAEPVSTHPVSKKASGPELDPRPIYKAEDMNAGRARIEPVRPRIPAVKYDQMLADQQPNESTPDVNRIDRQQIPSYAFAPIPTEVTYPDIPYAPGYGYENVYAPSSGNIAYLEPDTPSFGLLWSQVPDSRTIFSYVGRTINWFFGSFFVLLLGSFLTVGVCTYTNLCDITFNNIGPIHDEMRRTLMTPESLEKIGTAAGFVKTAIDKYQEIQNVDPVNRQQRALFKF